MRLTKPQLFQGSISLAMFICGIVGLHFAQSTVSNVFWLGMMYYTGWFDSRRWEKWGQYGN